MSEASGKTEERAETKDTKVSLQEATSGTDDDIVQFSKKLEFLFWRCGIFPLSL